MTWGKGLWRALSGARARAVAARRERRDALLLARRQERRQREPVDRASAGLREKASLRYPSAPHAVRAGPDFICIGMQKAGSIWLYDQTGNHPDIWQPPIKELHALTGNPTQRTISSIMRRHSGDAERLNDQRAERGRRGIDEADIAFVRTLATMTDKPARLDAYAQLFEPKGERLAGDITPGYSSLTAETARALAEIFPEVRIVFLAREPIDRAWSYVSMSARRVDRGLKEDIRVDDWASLEAMLAEHKASMRSSPSLIARRWRPHFGDRFGVFFFDDLRDDAEGLRRRVGEFIGVDPDRFGDLPAGHNRKAGQKKVEMSDEIRERLVAYFKRELRRSAQELGGRATEWPARYGL